MIACLDSNVLLAVLFNEGRREEAIRRWSEATDLVVSDLVEAECSNVIKRVMHSRHASAQDRSRYYAELEVILDGTTRLPFNAEIFRIIREDPHLVDARTLDAIHISTALFVKQVSQEQIQFVSFDRRALQIAQACGLGV